MPKFDLTSACRPSLFAYPPLLSATAAAAVSRAPAAVLSTTAKRKKKEADKKKKGVEPAGEPDKESAMETDDAKPAAAEEGAEENKPSKKEPEPTSEKLSNPCRVLMAQEKYIRIMNPNTRYVPVKKGAATGILLLKDTTPDEPQQLVSSGSPNAPPGALPGNRSAQQAAAAEEPHPPEAFDYPMP